MRMKMKMLTLAALLCAMMALNGAAAVTKAAVEPGRDGAVGEGEVSSEGDEALLELLEDKRLDGDTRDFADSPVEAESNAVKRSTSCPSGWTPFKGRCFIFVAHPMMWAQAEKNCIALGGHLTSVHSHDEHYDLKKLTPGYSLTWIGGSDGANSEGYWFWSDVTTFSYTAWCPGEPNNHRYQHCTVMNYSVFVREAEECGPPCTLRSPFMKRGITTPVCQSSGNALRLPRNAAEASQPRQPHNIQRLKAPRVDLIHPTDQLFDYLGKV
ncbi:ladderlectin-like [Parambassis ranga]|uniref:Ladderlectin-like n=1 Tax=Parambassis ranga TaxID=210632 RepID=A0A6P7IRJ8_9TELE|nr:ladderlectin-like [Parambassis ranga]